MATLYEITDEFQRLYQMADEYDLTPEDIADTLEGMEYELEDKADAYANVIRSLEGDSASLKAEIDRLTARKRTIENNIKNMKLSLEGAMRASGKQKIKTKLFSFGLQKNPPSLKIDDPDAIPAEYLILIIQEPKIDKKLLKEDLKAGVDLDGICHLEQSESLRIR